MYWVITIVLMFHGTEYNLEREYQLKTFHDDWSCHKFIHDNKMLLLEQHLTDYGERLKSFELYCESRYAQEV
jgi:hypothetical protein